MMRLAVIAVRTFANTSLGQVRTASKDFLALIVRRQSFWDSEQCKLREALARLVDDVTRLAVGVASGAGRWCGV